MRQARLNRARNMRGACLTWAACLSIVRRLHGGAVAQLGERLVRNEEVSGSIPLSSTTAVLMALSLLLPDSAADAGSRHIATAVCLAGLPERREGFQDWDQLGRADLAELSG